MKKLRMVVQYECVTSFKYIWIFYAVVFAVIAVISAIIFLVEGSLELVGTNCLEVNSLVYVGILGALGFKEDFRMLIQNGFTRTYIFSGNPESVRLCCRYSGFGGYHCGKGAAHVASGGI